MSISIEEVFSNIVIQETVQNTAITGSVDYVAIENPEGIETVTVDDPTFISIQEAFTELVSVEDENVTVTEVGVQGPSGVDGTGSTVSTTPAQAADGIRTAFTTPSAYALGSLQVYLNGLLESYITETSPTAFTFEDAPLTGDVIRLIYKTN